MAGGGTLKSFDAMLERAAKPVNLYAEDLTLKFSGEARYRLEVRDDFNLNDATFEDDAINLFRNRLGMEIAAGPYAKVFTQIQDAEAGASREAHKSEKFINRFDLHQLYADFKSPWEELPVSLRVGRQKLVYGDQRLVGAFEWSNVARSFDAVKAVWTPSGKFQTDLFFARPVWVIKSQADTAVQHDNFYGLYTSLLPWADQVFDAFLFIRHDRNDQIAGERSGQFGELKEYTVGNRFKGKKHGFDYGIEWAWQFGSKAHENIAAWAWHQDLGYTFKCPWQPRLSFEYNHASGDSDAKDGETENFDNLFPTNHIHYGYIDFASLRNTDNFKAGLDFKPKPYFSILYAHHWFFLDTEGSAWFDASQAVIRSSAPGASTTLGQEDDILLKIRLSAHLELAIGYSHFHAGAFARDTGTSDDAEFFYVMPTLSF